MRIDSSQLIQHHVSVSFLETTRNTVRIRVSTGCHRSYDDRLKASIQLVRRKDNAGSRLLDLSSDRGVQRHDEDIPAADRRSLCYHSQSTSSNRVGTTSSRSVLSPRSFAKAAASAHPALVAFSDWIIKPPSTTLSWTCPSNPASSSRGFGILTPCEFPIRTILVFIPIPRT